jgi:hypothetical protein
MIFFDMVIAVLGGEMAGSGHQLVEHPGIGRCFVGRHRVGVGAVIESRVKHRRVAAKSRFSDTSTSMTWPYWSIARYK